jgi:hypothetical protein
MDINALKTRLKNSSLKNVSHHTGVTRQTLHNFLKGGNATLSTLSALNSFFDETEIEKIYESLAYYGAPLAVTKSNPHFELNDTLKKALDLSTTDALVASTIPYVLFKQRASLDLTTLFRASVKSDTDKLLGYFLELANEFRNYRPFKLFSSNMKKLINYDNSPKKKLNGDSVGEEFLPLYSRNNLALSWGLFDRGEIKNHLDRFEKWLSASNK